ncbi:hypothetical protein DDF65_17455 [Caulobacter radicis]|uniref:Uncharacterized protein n=1 Tax=Caulobacter radicis TaxID=2172650 RepID=A0A2T9J626_9CAUL|nr:hypothetical protein DDF65_17455 [Caulobacter radicis]
MFGGLVGGRGLPFLVAVDPVLWPEARDKVVVVKVEWAVPIFHRGQLFGRALDGKVVSEEARAASKCSLGARSIIGGFGGGYQWIRNVVQVDGYPEAFEILEIHRKVEPLSREVGGLVEFENRFYGFFIVVAEIFLKNFSAPFRFFRIFGAQFCKIIAPFLGKGFSFKVALAYAYFERNFLFKKKVAKNDDEIIEIVFVLQLKEFC